MLTTQLEMSLALIDRVITQIDISDKQSKINKEKLIKVSEELTEIVNGQRLSRRDPNYPRSIDLV